MCRFGGWGKEGEGQLKRTSVESYPDRGGVGSVVDFVINIGKSVVFVK